MTVSTGNLVSVAYYNSIQSTVANVLGTGSGNSGYGQTLASSQLTSKIVTAADWQNLRADIAKCQTHQTGSDFSTATLPNIASGSMFNAADCSSYETCAGTINTNRGTPYILNMSSTSWPSIIRATTWGKGGTAPGDQITTEAKFDFGTADAFRYFFNTGGVVRFSLGHPSSSTPQDTSWQTLFSRISTVSIKASSATTTGSVGTLTNLGAYNATTSYQTILTASATDGAYASGVNTVLVQFKMVGTTALQVKITLTDGHTNTWSDVVASGTYVSFGCLKSTVVFNIPAPTYTVVTPF